MRKRPAAKVARVPKVEDAGSPTKKFLKKPAAATPPKTTPNKGGEKKEEPESEMTSPALPMKSATPDPSVTKKPAARAKGKPSPSGAGRATDVIETVNYQGGWKVLKIKTPKGRVYPKFVAGDGTYYFSLKQAEDNGFKNEPLAG